MASIIKKKDKKTGITYVYESESYWDKEKKQPRSKRKLIGKIDEETGEIVPTAGRGRPKKDPLADITGISYADKDLRELCQKQADKLRLDEDEISALKKQVMELTLSLEEYKRRLIKIQELSEI
ncbi:MAG: hypothetical protein LUF78_09730 [Clostridiales bacterium]|nr:hypothetical protein [Clostridiales bacterium]